MAGEDDRAGKAERIGKVIPKKLAEQEWIALL